MECVGQLTCRVRDMVDGSVGEGRRADGHANRAMNEGGGGVGSYHTSLLASEMLGRGPWWDKASKATNEQPSSPELLLFELVHIILCLPCLSLTSTWQRPSCCVVHWSVHDARLAVMTAAVILQLAVSLTCNGGGRARHTSLAITTNSIRSRSNMPCPPGAE